MPDKWEKMGDGLSRYMPNGVIYVKKAFKRHRIPNICKTTGETTRGRAKAKRDVLIQEHLDFYLKGNKSATDLRLGNSITVATAIDEFLQFETPKKRRRRTQENHRQYFKELRLEWGHIIIDRIDDNAWTAWLDRFQCRKSRKTFDDYAVYMNMLLRYAYKRKYISHLIKMPFLDEDEETGRVLSVDELERLFTAMGEETRDQFVLAYECCMRLREALYLTWDRVDLKSGLIRLRKEDVKTGSRTGKGRSFIASPNAIKRLKKRFATTKSKFVFPSKTKKNAPIDQNKTAWAASKRRAGIAGRLRWHDIRHTAISHLLLDKKENPVFVSEYAGVSLRTIQRVYLHSRAEQTREVSLALRVGAKKV